MSVYPKQRKDGSTVWHYDFVIEGRRFHGSTGQATKRAAEAYEARRRREIAEGKDDRAAVTVDLAAGRWWRDVGQHRADRGSVEQSLEWLIAQLGKNRMVDTITTADVLDLVERRRGEAAKTGGARPVTPSTVNKTVVEVLRPVLRHAASAYTLTMPQIDWRAATLKRKRRQVREEFQPAEIQAWLAELRPIERAFVAIDMRYGLRFGEMFFPPAAVEADDPAQARLRIGRYKGRYGWRECRKGGDDGEVGELVLPLLEEDARLLAALASRAAAAGLDVIWTEETRAGLAEIGYFQMKGRLERAAERAGLRPGRLIHGMRHHVGTTILRATGNLALAQRTLGHANVSTTQRYAHANEADIRAGIAAASRNSPDLPAPPPPKTLETKG